MSTLSFKNTKKTFMYKGIECLFSEKADDIVSTDAEKNLLLESFFSYEPINSIKWINVDLLKPSEDKSEKFLPMYRIGNGINELLLWPVLNGSDLWLGVQCSSERPDLANLKPVEKVR